MAEKKIKQKNATHVRQMLIMLRNDDDELPRKVRGLNWNALDNKTWNQTLNLGEKIHYEPLNQ